MLAATFDLGRNAEGISIRRGRAYGEDGSIAVWTVRLNARAEMVDPLYPCSKADRLTVHVGRTDYVAYPFCGRSGSVENWLASGIEMGIEVVDLP